MKAVRLTLAFVTLLALSIAAEAQRPERAQGVEDNPEQIFARAVQAHQSGDIEGAIREYQAYLALRPERVDARSNLGAALARLGRYAEAIEQYKRALALDGRNQDIRFNLALAYYKTAKILSASKELEAVVGAQTENRNALLLLADCNLRMGEFKKVIELLTPIVAEDNRAVDYMLGLALIKDKQLDKGQERIERIMRDGDSAEVHVMMGTTYLTLTEYEKALKEFKRAVELNPKLPSVNSFYGQTLTRMGATEEAMGAFRRELEINPNDFDSCLQMGILLKQDQKLDEARDYFRRALTVRPSEPNSRFYLASIDVAQGKLNEALPALEQLVKDAADFVEAHVMLATIYYRMRRKTDGDREQAIVNKLNAERQAKQPGAEQKQ
ncbi:MAG: tetratricopeptide repeat protein [Chloracidobacterium sp.]|nr:tetratricopeptide repeat protein [Chloracidobacterium sp.]